MISLLKDFRYHCSNPKRADVSSQGFLQATTMLFQRNLTRPAPAN